MSGRNEDAVYTKCGRGIETCRKSGKEQRKRCIGSEDLLLGLLREGKGTAAIVLRNNKVQEKNLEELIERLVTPETGAEISDSKSALQEHSTFLTTPERKQHHFVRRSWNGAHSDCNVKDLECAPTRLLLQ